MKGRHDEDSRPSRADIFDNGEFLSRKGGFVEVKWDHASQLQDTLVCEANKTGAVKTNIFG
jgi:hypothetical protein